MSSINGFRYFSLDEVKKRGYDIDNLPYSIKVLIENVLRNMNGNTVTEEDLDAISSWKVGKEIPFFPSRILLQDYTGIPLLVDLAGMRSAIKRLRGKPEAVNPLIQSDLVIDHSVQVDYFGTTNSLMLNMKKEFERNMERYKFLKWAQGSFSNLRIVTPGHGIVHQVNIEFLSQVAYVKDGVIYPDSLIGTDSHTTMVNGIGVLGWGVGGLEAEVSMLGEPYPLLVPEVIGVKLTGELNPGVTPTDVVLYVTETLRKINVVGKFVEFFGPSLSKLSAQDRSTVSNMAPEYGATVGYFPVDKNTLTYLEKTGRDPVLPREYFKSQGMFYSYEPIYSKVVEINLGDIEPSIAGPKNPEERVPLKEAKSVAEELCKDGRDGSFIPNCGIAIAAITSCTNTSNPTVMLGAGILAKNAIERGLIRKPYIKTSTAPGSRVVTDYLEKTNLLPYLEGLGFHVVGYGCTTCIGNAGPLIPEVEKDVREGTKAFAIISGNRNFEGRINPLLTGTFLASPILVVAYALAGRFNVDFEREPIGFDPNKKPVYLRDIWPSTEEINKLLEKAMDPEIFKEKYADAFEGNEDWNKLSVEKGELYSWDTSSTYIREPPWFWGEGWKMGDIVGAKILALFGDRVTTDHISPAGPITPDSLAGEYLRALGVTELNTFGARRGNHEVMLRGGFSNPKIKNMMVDKIGGYTKYEGKVVTIYEAAMNYQKKGIPLVIFAGKQYGTGSSRDWAAKVTALLGVRVVIAESFERIHRSNLVAMGVIPIEGIDWRQLGLTGDETINVRGLNELTPKKKVTVEIGNKTVEGIARVDNKIELEYVKSGGVFRYALNKVLSK
ncbi:aconitate hydratase 1 [Sulfolobales archaeon HS-7]|nr:aconitate hydratase 1 [Sulfolobales archaeon HS-7]